MQSVLLRPLCIGLLLAGSIVPHRASAQSTAPVSDGGSNPFVGFTLSAGQRAKLRELTTSTQQKRRAILERQKGNAPMSAVDQAALTRLTLAHNAAVRDLLDARQKPQFDDNVRRIELEHQRRRDANHQTASSHRRAVAAPEVR